MSKALALVFAGAALLACVCVVVYAVRQERARNAQTELVTEAAMLREAEISGALLVERERAADLERRMVAMMKQNADLEAAVAKVRKISPGAKATAVVQATVGPLVAGQMPLSSPDSAPPPRHQRPCLLHAGDQLELRVDQVLLETRGGNQLVVGAASAWTLDPETKLAGGPFEVATSAARAEPEKDEPRLAGWGLGPSAWMSTAGPAYGATLSPPPLDLWRLQVEVLAGAGLGPGGAQGAVSLLGRIR